MERVRQRFVEEGLASALSPYRGGKRIYARKLDGTQEAHLIALACSKPPEGSGRWTLRLLARRMVELAYVDRLSHETVRQTLKTYGPPRLQGVCGGWPLLGLRKRIRHVGSRPLPRWRSARPGPHKSSGIDSEASSTPCELLQARLAVLG